MTRIIVVLVGLTVGACTYQAQVPAIDGAALPVAGTRQPGRFAALVQTGGWDMTTEIFGISCSLHTYKADLNPAWDGAMKSALTNALEKVEFVAEVLPAPELVKLGYDGQIAVTPSNASTKMGVMSRFFSADAVSETSLDGILVVSFPDGTLQQEAVRGRGVSQKGVFTCGDIPPAIGDAGALAVQDIVQRTTTTIKLLLAQKVRPGAQAPGGQ